MTLASGTVSRSKSFLQSSRCRTADRTLVMMSASFSVVLTLCSVIGKLRQETKSTSLRGHGDARASLKNLCSPPCVAHRCPRSHHRTLVSKLQASSAPLTRSMTFAARPHSIDPASVELVLFGPCRRLAHSIKKELPLDPVKLTLYPPKHLVPHDASQKVLSLSSSQS